MNTVHTRTLLRALQAYGGNREALASQLEVSIPELSAWLEGSGTPPTRIYLQALDIVARGPLHVPTARRA